METFLIYLAIVLGVANAVMPLVKKIVSKTKTKNDDKVVEIIEEQCAVNRHATIFDTLRCNGVFRVAYVRCKCVLLGLEIAVLNHVQLPMPGSRFVAA